MYTREAPKQTSPHTHPTAECFLERLWSGVRGAVLPPARFHEVVDHLLEKRLVGTGKTHLDEWLHQGAALDVGDVHQLVVAISRLDFQLRALLDLPSPPDLIPAPDRDTSLGVSAAPDTVIRALEDARDSHLFGGPGSDAGDDGHAVVDDEGLQVPAVLAEEWVVRVLGFNGPSFVVVEVGVWRDERLICL